jgi:hypothetical protein
LTQIVILGQAKAGSILQPMPQQRGGFNEGGHINLIRRGHREINPEKRWYIVF